MFRNVVECCRVVFVGDGLAAEAEQRHNNRDAYIKLGTNFTSSYIYNDSLIKIKLTKKFGIKILLDDLLF